MIHELRLKSFFVHADKTFAFSKGLTGIIGPNESGKSLILEGVRYALFGTAALRGGASSDLHVELDFSVKGISHTVVRKGRNATLDGNVIGTKPVNEAVIKLLDYDLDVFDVANACNQGQVEALSDMKPAERKAMVDRTVGLDTLDAVIKYCGERGNALKNQASGFERGLVQPTAVEEPIGRSVEDLTPLVVSAKAETTEMNKLQGFVFTDELPGSGRTIEDLLPLIADAQAELVEFNQLAGYLSSAPTPPPVPAACLITDTLDALVAYQDQRAMIRQEQALVSRQIQALTPEVFNTEQLDQLEAQWDQYGLWMERTRLLAQGHICCPSCNHSWPVAGNLPEVEETSAPAWTRVQISNDRRCQGNAQKIAELEALVLDEIPTDRSADLAQRRAYEADVEASLAAQAAYLAYNDALPAKQARHAALSGAGALVLALTHEKADDLQRLAWAAQAPKRDRLAALEQSSEERENLLVEFAVAKGVEAAWDQYQTQLVAYQVAVAEHATLVASSEKYLNARTAITALKIKVKTFLLPSLNKVASHFLSEMTGGERYDVVIDEDFQILIDGQPINVLSGSGKAVANLAIRLALGQILTNKMFSVFMADEIDGSMDVDRADYTANALKRLTGLISQVILITHKRPETDHMIELKK